MARRIFKYELSPRHDLIGWHPEVHVEIPRGAELLHVDAQGERLFLWAIVDPEAEKARYSLVVLPTGGEVTWPSDFPLRHVGTVLMQGGTLVWHVFTDWQARP